MIPEKIQLDDDEQVLLQVRKHWFVLCVSVCTTFFSALIPLPFFAVISYSTIFSHIPFLNTPFLVNVYTVWLILHWMTLFSIWTNYYLDIWIVTNKRFIAVDQRGFFSRKTASFRLDRLQDISVTIHGIIPTFLNFGTITIQTAGEQEQFTCTGMPSPTDIKATILNKSGPLVPSTPPQSHAEV